VRLGIAGTILPADLRQLTPQIVRTVRTWGYTGIFTRFRDNHPLTTSLDDAYQAREIMASEGVDHVMATGFWQCLIHPDAARRAEAVRVLRGALRLAGALGATAIDTGPGSLSTTSVWGPHRDNWQPWAEANLIQALREAAPIAEEANVRIHLEGHQYVVLKDAETMARVIDAVGSPWLKCDIDPVNWITLSTYYHTGSAIDAMFDVLGDRIGSGHSKDILIWDTHTVHLDTVTTGQGAIDHQRYLQRLHALDPEIYLVVEACSTADAPGVCAFLRRQAELAGVEVH